MEQEIISTLLSLPRADRRYKFPIKRDMGLRADRFLPTRFDAAEYERREVWKAHSFIGEPKIPERGSIVDVAGKECLVEEAWWNSAQMVILMRVWVRVDEIEG
jgi:hypothetical protein